ncbi:hypothetical protein ABW21_db0203541 [Orbilia brochopaga]|nr:hypothetical protein ABW21_db0203541 [Drechslerella brochopaga]
MSSPNPLEGDNVPPHILTLLDRLHAESLDQEAGIARADYDASVIHDNMKDKFIALEPEKCQFVYQLARAINAKYIVEAGTSYGVSTIYLALAVAANCRATGGQGKVVGTEHEVAKAGKARAYWEECGDIVKNVVELRQGDLRITLKGSLEVVDLLLLDRSSHHLHGSTTRNFASFKSHLLQATTLCHGLKMVESVQHDSVRDAISRSPPGSPVTATDIASPVLSTPIDITPSSTATFPRTSKASTFSVLSFAPPRRPALADDTFDANAPPYRHVSAGASEAIAPLTQQTNVEFARRPLTPRIISDDKKENRKVSVELTKQLESLLKPASRSTSASSARAKPIKSSSSSAWAVTDSSIAIRHSSPVQSVTTQIWEPPPEVEPSLELIPAPEIQSEYFSFPPFESYPKNALPGLRKKHSDENWVLLQKLKGKIVEMHNNGQLERSGRSSSQTSLSSSRKSRRASRSPSKPSGTGKPHLDTTHSARRRASDSEATGHHSRPEFGFLTSDKAATVTERSTRSSSLKQDVVPQECDDNTTCHHHPPVTDIEAVSSTPAQDSLRSPPPEKHITIIEPDALSDTNDGSRSPSKTSNIVGLTSIASSIFQSLVTIATGDTGEQSSALASISAESSLRSKASNSSPYRRKETRGGKAKDQENASSGDSSEDEMTFLEYVKRFADGSPPPGKRIGRIMSPMPVGGLPASPEIRTEHLNKGKEAIPRTVKFEAGPVESRDSPEETSDSDEVPDSSSAHEHEPSSLSKAMPEEEDSEGVPYRADDYNIITEYFYNTQGRLLRQKWPFLLDNEVQYLIENKWLEMEWEDLEEWAQESAKHIDEEGYVEPDLFEDIELVDPRSPEFVKKEDELRETLIG